MNVYAGIIHIKAIVIDQQNPNGAMYSAPELLTIMIAMEDETGGMLVFRLGRDDYDKFREAVIKQEGYPK